MSEIDWIRHHKSIYEKRLPNGFSVYISVNIHESGKITVRLNCSVIIGSFPVGLKDDLGNLSDTLRDMSDELRITNEI